jgi:hypothetical protein
MPVRDPREGGVPTGAVVEPKFCVCTREVRLPQMTNRSPGDVEKRREPLRVAAILKSILYGMRPGNLVCFLSPHQQDVVCCGQNVVMGGKVR